MGEKTYKCRECGSEKTVEEKAGEPECCGEKMELKEVCREAPHPEMARNYEKNEPCDDGGSGKRV